MIYLINLYLYLFFQFDDLSALSRMTAVNDRRRLWSASPQPHLGPASNYRHGNTVDMEFYQHNSVRVTNFRQHGKYIYIYITICTRVDTMTYDTWLLIVLFIMRTYQYNNYVKHNIVWGDYRIYPQTKGKLNKTRVT